MPYLSASRQQLELPVATSSARTRLRLAVPVILGLLFLVQWSLLFRSSAPVWDEAFYYAYAHSAAFDGDLHLENDFKQSYSFTPPFFAERAFHEMRTATGRVHSPFAIGTALLWLPLFLLLRLLMIVGSLVNLAPMGMTGYEPLFTGAIATFSALCGWLAFWMGYRIARQIADPAAALLSTVTLMFATPLLVYQFRLPLMSHASSAFVTCLCLFIWWRVRARPLAAPDALTLGAAVGLAALVRWQHATYLVLPLGSVAHALWAQRRAGEPVDWAGAARYLLLLGGAAFVVFSPQLAVWRLFYGDWLTIPQGAAFMNWQGSYVWPLLFSTYRGLFPWMPVAALAMVGLGLLARRRPEFAGPLIVVLLLEIYINGSTPDWFAGGGFGPRRFTSEVAIFLIGYAGLLHHLAGRLNWLFGGTVAAILALHQWILLRFGLPEKIGGEHLSFGPTYEWVDEPWSGFISQIAGHLPDLFRQPVDFFVQPDAPLFLWLQTERSPIEPFLLLAGMLLSFLLVLMGGRRLRNRLRLVHGAPYYVAGGLVLLIAIADYWILFLA